MNTETNDLEHLVANADHESNALCSGMLALCAHRAEHKHAAVAIVAALAPHLAESVEVDEAPRPDIGPVSPGTLSVVAAATAARSREFAVEFEPDCAMDCDHHCAAVARLAEVEAERDTACSLVEFAEGIVEVWRPVVEAVIAWRDGEHGAGWVLPPTAAQLDVLIAAVDALPTQPLIVAGQDTAGDDDA